MSPLNAPKLHTCEGRMRLVGELRKVASVWPQALAIAHYLMMYLRVFKQQWAVREQSIANILQKPQACLRFQQFPPPSASLQPAQQETINDSILTSITLTF